jgi:hypothetical protein
MDMKNRRTMMKLSMKHVVGLTGILLLSACTQELSIADFEDDFKDYEQEYRVEGLLDHTDFSRSVIRLDRTVLVTDTSLFNGRDDNGDWESYTDVNGNGRWDEGEPLNDDIGTNFRGPEDIPEGRGNGIPDPGEPHVDDYIEILPQIHDSTATSVILREFESQNFVAEFQWASRAASFDESFGPGGPPELAAQNPYIRYYYGGYVPSASDASLQLSPLMQYEVVITTSDGQLISAVTDIVTEPIHLNWEGTTCDGDTLVSPSNNYAFMTWNNPGESFFGGLELDLYFRPDSVKGFYAYTRAAFQLDPETELPLFQESFVGFPLGMYRITVNSFNDGYGSYVYSNLPLRDRELSNWRDQEGRVILGHLGSRASIQFYLRLASPTG